MSRAVAVRTAAVFFMWGFQRESGRAAGIRPKEVTAMPHKPAKPCAHQGCRELTTSRYCDTHTRQEAKQYNRYYRDPNSRKRYGGTWKRIRAAFLAANPLCVICKQDGRLTPATLVHHKVKLTDGGTNEWHNLTALCSSCHSRLHTKQGDCF